MQFISYLSLSALPLHLQCLSLCICGNDAVMFCVIRAGNLGLLPFLVGLKTANEDELVATLVVNILKVCPDLLGRYFKEIQYSYIPRIKSTWLLNIRLLKKVRTKSAHSLLIPGWELLRRIYISGSIHTPHYN